MRKTTKKKLYKALLPLFCALVAAVYYWLVAPAPAAIPPGEFSLHVIDVGQGDALLLTCGDQSALIDAGTPDKAPELIAYLKSQGLGKPDYVFATHPHADHIGGMAQVLDAFGCDAFYMPQATAYTQAFEQMLGSLEHQGIAAQFAAAGDSFALGNAKLQVLWPQAEYSSEEMNNMSLVLQVTYGPYSFLLTGDAESSVEKRFLEDVGPIQVLKAGHHGSDTSSSAPLLAAAKPQYCAVSVGAGNSYNHPSASVVEALAGMGCQVLRTDQNGTIVFTVDEGGLHVATAR